MNRWICTAAIIAALAAAAPVEAQEEKWKKVTAPEVKDMLEGGKTVAIHVLSRIEYEMQHISGSINIPITEMQETDRLPKDKETPLIFYCMGYR